MKNISKSILKKQSLLNLVYRVLTILFKFLLSIIIVKKLSVYDLGVYGIFQTTLILLVYVLGYDFYTYNTRELLKENNRGQGFYFFNQVAFHGIMYVIVLPIVLLVFFYQVIDFDYIFYFYLILVAEHVSQELYRILITLKKSVVASLSLFLRSGSWILALYLLWTFNFSEGKISDIFILWLLGAIISIVVGLYSIGFKIRFELDFDWIKKGVKVATPFFVSTIFYKIIEFSGRFFLDFYWTKEEVGVFTFFSGISNAMFVFVQSTVIIVMSPYLIQAANKGFKEFKKPYRSFRKQILISSIIGLFFAVVFIKPVLIYLENDLLLDNIWIYFLLLLATTFFCFSYIPHYGLYAFHKDKYLLKASVIGAFVNVLFNFVFVPKYGIIGAGFAQLLSMFSLFITKQIFYKGLRYDSA